VSIEKALASRQLPERDRRLLGEVAGIRKFAESAGLKPTRNYRSYVRWDGPAVVWVVSASERLELKRREFSFPIVGRMPYISWFSRKDADNYARSLEMDENLDVDIRGAPAYSTLGWFEDPILSTMFQEGAAFGESVGDLASIVIHESVHATHYLKGWGQWNESVAERVAGWLTPKFLAERFGADSPELTAYVDGERRSEAFAAKVAAVYQDLEQLYRSSVSDEEKRARKAEHFKALPPKWNNASLLYAKTYGADREERAAWESLFQKCGSDIHRFLGRVGRIDPDRDWSGLKPGESILPNLALITDC